MAKTKHLGNKLRRTKVLAIHLSTDEFGRLIAAAEGAATPRAVWVRCQALRAASTASGLPARFQALPARGSARLTRRIDFCLTEDQFEALNEQAIASGMASATFVREVLAGRKPAVRHPLARSAIVAVNRAGDSLKRLLQLADSGTLLAPELASAVAELRQEVHALRDALLTADAAAPGPHA